MNQQVPGHQQGNFPNQSFQPTQNGGQQRPAANGLQKPAQGQQPSQNSLPKYNPPKLVLFTLEKPRHVEGWDDVQPEQQRIAAQDLQKELVKFQRNQGSVKRALDEISSPSCRRLLNDLVKEETDKLWEHNKSLQYTIVAVMNTSRWLDERKRHKELKRVQVILETEPSGFTDTQGMKNASGAGSGGANIHGGQEMNKGKQTGMGNQSQNMGPQTRPQQGNNMGQGQNFEQRPPGPPGGGHMQGGGAPPPPPPPPGGGHHGHPPPPPPPGGQPGGHPPPPGMHYPQGNGMQGGFPPMQGMRPGQPPVQVIDPRFMHQGKPKKGGRDESSSESSSEWDTESSSSGSEPYRVRNVEHGYGLVGKKEKRGRGKRSKSSKKYQRSRSQSQGLSRSRSRSRPPHHSSRRRKDADLIDPRRHSATSSGANSPNNVPQVNIYMPNGNNSSGDERRHGHRKRGERRDSHHETPTSTYHKSKYGKKATSYPMARGGSRDSNDSWQSVDRSSESSFATSSVRTGEGSFIDTSRRPRSHRQSISYSRPHPGSFTQPHTTAYADFEELNRRNSVRDVYADDYPGYGTSPPRGRNQYHAQGGFSRPLPHRRNTMQGYGINPFDAATRERIDSGVSYAYSADVHPTNVYNAQRQLRYSPGTSPAGRDRFEIDEIASAVVDKMEKKTQRVPVPLRRRHTERIDDGLIHGDEWDLDARYRTTRERAYGGAYGRYA